MAVMWMAGVAAVFGVWCLWVRAQLRDEMARDEAKWIEREVES